MITTEQWRARETVHPPTWWYRLLSRWFPNRCREIPEATDPSGKQVLLRQFAIVKKYVYLQQFASSEHPLFYHRHGWRWIFVFVLWGSYFERRLGGWKTTYRGSAGPEFYVMNQNVVHQVHNPSPGHTSIAIGLFRDGERVYFEEPTPIQWRDHVRVRVKEL